MIIPQQPVYHVLIPVKTALILQHAHHAKPLQIEYPLQIVDVNKGIMKLDLYVINATILV